MTTETQTIAPDTEAPEGRLYLIAADGTWARDTSPAKALKKARGFGLKGRADRLTIGVWEVSPDTYIDVYGGINIPEYNDSKMYRPVKVAGWKTA